MFVISRQTRSKICCVDPKIPNYVIYDLKYIMIRLKLLEATVPLFKDVDPAFCPYLEQIFYF